MAAERWARVGTGAGSWLGSSAEVFPPPSPVLPPLLCRRPPPFRRTHSPFAYAALLLRPPTTALTGVARACREGKNSVIYVEVACFYPILLFFYVLQPASAA